MAKSQQPTPQEFVPMKEIARRCNIGTSTGWRWVSEGKLPQPAMRMGRRCTRWCWTEVESYLRRQGQEFGA